VRGVSRNDLSEALADTDANTHLNSSRNR